jgi:hypothetical protein
VPVRFQLVIDCADPDRLARFWAAALGYELAPAPAGFATWNDFYRELGVPEEELVDGADRISDPEGHGPSIWFHVVPDAKAVKNRLHLDIHASGERTDPIETRGKRVDAEASRLAGLDHPPPPHRPRLRTAARPPRDLHLLGHDHRHDPAASPQAHAGRHPTAGPARGHLTSEMVEQLKDPFHHRTQASSSPVIPPRCRQPRNGTIRRPGPRVLPCLAGRVPPLEPEIRTQTLLS